MQVKRLKPRTVIRIGAAHYDMTNVSPIGGPTIHYDLAEMLRGQSYPQRQTLLGQAAAALCATHGIKHRPLVEAAPAASAGPAKPKRTTRKPSPIPLRPRDRMAREQRIIHEFGVITSAAWSTL